MRQILYILLTLVLLSACISRPANVLDEDQFTDVLIDVHMAEGLLDVQRDEGNSLADNSEQYQQEVMAAVLLRHGIQKAEYDSSLVWYSRNLKLLIRVYKRVQDSLTARHEWWIAMAEGVREFEISQQGDSVQLWTLDDYQILMGSRPHNSRMWRIERDSNYLTGDTLRWQFDAHQLQGRQLIATLALTMQREDSTWQQAATVVAREDQHYILTAVGDPKTAIARVRLSAHLLPLNGNDTAISNHPILLDNIRLTRYHKRP